MPCFRPLDGWRSKARNPKTGKRSIVFSKDQALVDMPVTLPCGRCIGCRLEHSRQWAIRCVHEASLHEENCFITLTYDEKHLPAHGSLVKSDFQTFMKDLRWHFLGSKRRPGPRFGTKIRYFHCGEYGEDLGRPHYHACLFNLDFADKRLWKKSEGGDLYVSDTLNQIWAKGYCILGAVSFDSAAYVARYITKKILGDAAEDHYAGRCPEYVTMSRRPGIGADWFRKWKRDCYPSDTVIMRGKEFRPPKFYDRQFEIDSPLEFAKVKRQRKAAAPDDWDPEFSPSRLAVKEQVQCLNLASLKRSYEK